MMFSKDPFDPFPFIFFNLLLSIVAAPEGVARVAADHPSVTVYTVSVDSGLNDDGYIVPGLGDAGDRLYGTR